MRRHLILWPILAVLILAGLPLRAWAIGFQLGESKEELRLDYQVTATDHGTGRVTIVLSIADAGRLGPLDSVDFFIPGGDGTGYADLSLSLQVHEVEGRREARVHLLKETAERAEFRLKTHHLDGRQEPLTWYYFSIPLAEHLVAAAGD